VSNSHSHSQAICEQLTLTLATFTGTHETSLALKVPTIVCNQLGILYAGIAFYPKSRDFETPKTFQAGFLIAKDVLSCLVYCVVLRENQTASEMERAFVFFAAA
jgi:hypothetical protein